MGNIIKLNDFATSTMICLSIVNIIFFIYYQWKFKLKALFSYRKKIKIILFGVLFGLCYFFIIPPTTNTIYSTYIHPLLIILNFYLVAQYTDALGTNSFYKARWKGERSTIDFSKISKIELEKNRAYFTLLVYDGDGKTYFEFSNKDEEKIVEYLKSKRINIIEK